MKCRWLVWLAIATACGTPPVKTKTETAAGDVALPSMSVPNAATFNDAYNGTKIVDVNRRVAILDLYVRGIEARLRSPSSAFGGGALMRTSVQLKPRVFADVSEEAWARMEAFYDRTELKRLRMLPPPGPDQRTEEFYFNDGRLVYVYIEPDGGKKRDPHVETTGDAYYFGRDGMIAWVRPDGRSTVDPKSSEFKAWSEQLQREGDHFPREAKVP